MLNGNSFSFMSHLFNQNSNNRQGRENLPEYYPPNIPMELYQTVSSAAETAISAEQYEEEVSAQQDEMLQNSEVNKAGILAWFLSEQDFMSAMMGRESIQQKITGIKDFVENELWDKEQEIPFAIDDQAVNGFVISPAFLHHYLTYWQQKIENNADVSAEIKEQVKALCDETFKTLKEHVAKQDIKTLQAIVVDSLYIAARLAEGNATFNQLKDRLVYYFEHCSSNDLRMLIATLYQSLECFSKHEIDYNDVKQQIRKEVKTLIARNVKEQINLSQDDVTESSLSFSTKAAALVTAGLVFANQMVVSAGLEYQVNKIAWNVTNPGLASKNTDNSYSVFWRSSSDNNVYANNVFPQNGTTKSATDVVVGSAFATVVNSPSLATMQCPSYNKAGAIFNYNDWFYATNRTYSGWINGNTSVLISERQLALPTYLTSNLKADVFSDTGNTVVMTYPDYGTVPGPINIRTSMCFDPQFINSSVFPVSGTAPNVGVTSDQSAFWFVCTGLLSGFKRIWAQLYNKSITSLTSINPISGASDNADNSSVLSINATSALVTWEQQNGTSTEVMGTVINRNGGTFTSATPFSLSTTFSSSVNHTQPQVKKLADGSFFEGFVETNTTTNLSRIMGTRFVINSDGTRTFKNNGTRVISEDSLANYPAYAMQTSADGQGVEFAYQYERDGVSSIRVKHLPILGLNIIQDQLTISEGASVNLTSTNLQATQDGDALGTLTLNFSNLSSSTSVQVNNGTGWNNATSCTQAQVQSGNSVRIVHDGSEIPPAYNVAATNGTVTTSANSALVTYIPVNDPPIFTVNTFGDVSNARTYNLTTSLLAITDPDNTASKINITVAEPLTNVSFEKNDGLGNWLTTTLFSYWDVVMGYVRFVVGDSPVSPTAVLSAFDGQATTNVTITANSMIFIPSTSPTPSVTPTPSRTPTPSVTPTASITPTVTPTPSITPTTSITPSLTPTPRTVVKNGDSGVPTNTIIGGVVGAATGAIAMATAIAGGIWKYREDNAKKAAKETRQADIFANALYEKLRITAPKDIRDFTSDEGKQFVKQCESLLTKFFDDAVSGNSVLMRRYSLSEDASGFEFSSADNRISYLRQSGAQDEEQQSIGMSEVDGSEKIESTLDKLVSDVATAIDECGFIEVRKQGFGFCNDQLCLKDDFYSDPQAIVRQIKTKYSQTSDSTNSSTPLIGLTNIKTQ